MDKYIVTREEIVADEGVAKTHFLNDNAKVIGPVAKPINLEILVTACSGASLSVKDSPTMWVTTRCSKSASTATEACPGIWLT